MYILSYEGAKDNSNPFDENCLQVIAQYAPPYFYVLPNRITGQIEYSGTFFNVINEAAKLGNFCYNITISSLPFEYDLEKNETDPAETFFGSVYAGIYDIASSPGASINDKYYATSDFIGFNYVTPIYKYPSFEEEPIAFLKPFSHVSWLVLLTSLLIAMGMASFIGTVGSEIIRLCKALRTNLADYLFVPVRVLVRQEVSFTYVAWSYRVFLAVWIYGCFLATEIYKSNLIAILTTPKYDIPFESFKEMVGQDKMPWVFLSGSYAYHYFRDTEEGSLYRRVYDGVYTHQETATTKFLSDMLQGKVSLISSALAVRAFTHLQYQQNLQCMVRPVQDVLMPRIELYTLSKHYAYLVPFFNKVISAYKQSGIHDKQIESKMYYAPFCENNLKNNWQGIRPLTIRDLYGVFLLMLAGHLVGLLLLVVEISFSERRRCKQGQAEN